MFQALPFQCSVSVPTATPDEDRTSPTAQMSFAATAVTPLSAAEFVPPGCCTGTTAQVVPLKFIASAPAEPLPTSQILLAEAAVMDDATKLLSGRGTVPHAVPSQ